MGSAQENQWTEWCIDGQHCHLDELRHPAAGLPDTTATTLVFDYGGDVTLAQLEASLMHGAGWTLSEFVDTFYVTVVIAADIGLLMLVGKTTRRQSNEEAIRIRQSKITITVLTVSVLLLSLLLPLENRYFLLLIPLALMFERKLSALIFR